MGSLSKKTFQEIFKSGLWQGQEKFSDGCLLTEDGVIFKIHRVVLSQRSEYFRALFSFNLSQETFIPSIDSKTLENILLYIYTGSAHLSKKNVWDMMVASDYLLLDDLLKKCRSFAIQSMTTKNCLSSLIIALQIDRLAILNDCYRYVLVHFEEILLTSTESISDLPFETIKELLKSDSLNVSSEKTVWEVIVRWTEAKSSTRLPHVSELVTYVRLEVEVDEELATEILSHPLVSSNPFCEDLQLNKQFNYFLTNCTVLLSHANYTEKYNQAPPSLKGPRVPTYMYFIASHFISPTQYGNELYLTYDDKLDFWRRIGDIQYFIDIIVNIGQYLYLFNTWDNIILAFDIIEEIWIHMNITFSPRYNYHVVTMGGYIYVIGGYTETHEATSMILYYEPNSNLWRPIRMRHDMLIHGAVGLNDQIYFFGQYDEDRAIVCQAYNPVSEFWTVVSPPKVFRRNFSAVTSCGVIYLIGGENGDLYLKSVEAYYPDQDSWQTLPDLPFQYFLPKAVVVNGRIIVYENNHEDTRFYDVPPPIYWDSSAQLWCIIDESSPLRCIERYTFCVLDECRLVKDITAKNRRPDTQWERILPV
ncbi:kelch repeat and BTB domain-containing protein 7 [Nephila pilipes]|uniref:Kelch-like protein diablo n=1 Tax=Nephila pilipes TaxID=299642 RepID=A0A8X6T8U6_NEPPI|nr:kelch repeat and BTB domain-containing protein 7 [Nephila pilipes]